MSEAVRTGWYALYFSGEEGVLLGLRPLASDATEAEACRQAGAQDKVFAILSDPQVDQINEYLAKCKSPDTAFMLEVEGHRDGDGWMLSGRWNLDAVDVSRYPTHPLPKEQMREIMKKHSIYPTCMFKTVFYRDIAIKIFTRPVVH